MELGATIQKLTDVVSHSSLRVPEAMGELGVIVGVAAIAVLVHAVLQRRFHHEVLRRHNDVAGFLFSAVGVIYAVVLGFVVVVVWGKYDATVANVEDEVSAVADLYHTVEAYPNPLRQQLRSTLLRYVDTIVRVEWPEMERGEYSATGDPVLERVGTLTAALVPANARESNAQQQAMSQMLRLYDARRRRLVHAAPSVPAVLWFALAFGAGAMLAVAFLFGMESRPAQLVMTAILAGLIVMLFVVINEFDSPFSGSVRISDAGWVYLQHVLPHVP